MHDGQSTPTERQHPIERTERLGYVAPCRCAHTQDVGGHRHECIAGQGHAGQHRCYCGAWFQTQDEGSSMPQHIGEHIDYRAARLKPEFAHLYPAIPPGVWLLAAAIVSAIWHDEVRGHGRRLVDEHFEFYGEAEKRPPGARTRSGDPPPHDRP